MYECINVHVHVKNVLIRHLSPSPKLGAVE